MGCISDSFNRPINYLRISITDRCNLRCVYCMPASGATPIAHGDMLRFEEIVLVVRAAAALGVSKLRLTGGEPLVRSGVVDLVVRLAAIDGIDDVSLTTNGTLLARYAGRLRRAGLARVNVSLDSLQPERFNRITRGGTLADVLAGVAAAQQAGLQPVKINVVVIRGVNDDEVLDFARRTLIEPWHVRFIEFMPFPERQDDLYAELACRCEPISVSEVKQEIEQLGPLEAVHAVPGNGPARYYRLPGALGTIGFISPVSEHFCFHCNRLRLTSDGRLRPCLLDDNELDVCAALRAGASEAELSGLIRSAIMAKPAQHGLAKDIVPHRRGMAQIGG